MGGVWKSISVRLDANVGGYVTKIGSAAAATRKLGQEFVDVASKTDSKTRQVTAMAGKLALGVGLAATLALGMATKATIGFDKAMSGVSAVTRDATQSVDQHARSQDRLREAALQAGKATVFSATEAATATGELARAGVGVRDILGGALRGSLDLAAAGQLELKSAATITAQALNVFQLRGSQATRVADTLAAGSNKSAADVTQLGEALRMGGLVARQVGLTLEQTTGILSLFADNALIGSDAGTSLKTMLQRLSPQSKEAAALMKHLGLEFFDAKGEFIGIERMAGVLQKRLGGLSQEQRLAALTTIFGADAIRSANILYTEGAAGVREYVRAVTDQGAAQRMAAEQLDNLAGDLEQFKGSLETAFITGGSSATGVLRAVTQGATNVVNGFLELPRGAQQAAAGVTVVTAAVGSLAGGFLLLAPRINQALTLYRELTVTAPRLAAALRFSAVGAGILGTALVGGALVLAAYGAEKAKAARLTDDFTQALKREQEGLDGEVNKLIASELGKRKVLSQAKELGISMKTVTAAIRGSESAWSSLSSAQDRAGELVSRAGTNENRDRLQALARLVQNVEDLRSAYRSGKVDAKELAAAEKELGVASAQAAGSNENLNDQLEQEKHLAEETAKRISALAGALRTIASPSSALASVTSAAREAAEGALSDRQDAEREAMQTRHSEERAGLERQRGIVGEGGAAIVAEQERVLKLRQDAEEKALAKRQDSERKGQLSTAVNLRSFAEELERQTKDAMAFQRNLLSIARRFGPEVARAVADMGDKSLAAAFVQGDPVEAKRAADALKANIVVTSIEAGQVLDDGFQLMQRLAEAGGKGIADKFLAELKKGEQPLADIVARYLALLTPLTGPGAPVVDTTTGKVVAVRTADGNFRTISRTGGTTNVMFNAAGSVRERHDPQTASAGTWRVWAEPETGGETYIPHAMSKRRAATGHLARTARIFGYDLVSLAGGGVTSTRPTPAGGSWSMSVVISELQALRATVATMTGSTIDARQTNHFHGDDRPSAAQLEYANRQHAWSVAGAVQR